MTNLQTHLFEGDVYIKESPEPTIHGYGNLNVEGDLNLNNINLYGSTSGVISILPQNVTGTYNLNLPITPGAAGQVLTSQGGTSNAMTWETPVGTLFSVAATVPSFLSISGSPITSTGTLAISYSGTALPVLNGGTGSTTSTGSGSVVLANTPTLITPVLGVASGTSLSVSSTITGSQLISTIASGTAPLSVSSTTNVANLNASSIDGNTFTSPGPIGTVTPGTGAFTNVTCTSFVSSTSHLFNGSTSGTISVLPQAVSGTWNFNLPTTAGTAGQALISGGGSSSPMTWLTLTTGTVTSVAATVPSFLSVSGSPITSTGTLAISYSGTALPVLNGGTGSTTSTGSGSVVLANTPTLITPVLGVASGTSLSVSSTITGTQLISTIATGTAPLSVSSTTNVANLNASSINGNTFPSPGPIGSVTPGTGSFTSVTSTSHLFNGSTSGTISVLPQTVSGTFNFNLPTTAGTAGQALISGGGSSSPMTWLTLTTGTVTSVAATVPSFLSVSGSPVTSTGTLAISYSGTALPVLNGGTGSTTSTGSGSVVLANTPTLITPILGVATGTSLSVSSTITGTQLISTIATGTTPLSVSSTTNVANLNASSINGNTFPNPGPIGSVTPGTGAFTSVTSTSNLFNGSTSGTISVLPQAVSGTYNFNLPTTAGSAGQVLTSNGGGSNEMTWTNPSLFAYRVWFISDIKPIGTNGGSFNNGAFITRTLNTITSYNGNSNVTISSNIITVLPGTYKFEIDAPAYKVNSHTCRLYNVTTSSVQEIGTTEFSNSTSSVSKVNAIIVIASTTSYRIEHRCQNDSANIGLGDATGFQDEKYTTCVISQLA